ncbi:MAG: chemotaxis protein CheW [Alphaproteobacteria bacterium]
MDELLTEFLTETAESLSTLDVELVRLEQNPDDPKLIDNIFRLVHTIKGTCGFLGLPRLAAVAHSSENVLGKIRDGAMTATPVAVTLILASLDRIKDLLAALEQTEAEPAGDDNELIDKLDAMAAGELVEAPVAAVPDEPEDFDATLGRSLKPGEVSLEELERVFQETSAGDDEEPAATPAPVAAAEPEATPEPAKPVAAAPAPKPAEVKPATAAKPEGGGESSVANQSIRVSVEQLENLMTMVSELVLTRNQLMQMVRGRADSEFKVPLQRLSHVTTELQEGVMKTRMQPIGNAWAKLPRIIRDLSHDLSKKIELQMLGADTELDRQVLELIKDPLTHMVRNSADHGLETPAERTEAGKAETGKVVLNAYHEGGHIIIEIKDDGRGLDVDRIRAKVLEKGLASEADLQSMSDQKIQQFIFAPGFSTAAEVTAVSGRGVGMDVVRTNIEKIGGTVELKSVVGRGSTFTIKIPLTLAIVSALVVECAGERFAIPQISVIELVRAASGSEQKIETINGTPVLRLRNRLLPLVYLDQSLQLREADTEPPAEVYVVVTQVGAYTFGIVVDKVFDTEEIVVKPVAPLLRDIAMFSGNTILGDGSVIMILDPNGIAASTSGATMHEDEGAELARQGESRGEESVAMLLFRAGGGEPKAVPLSLVARLEDIPVEAVEFANERYVTQYRGKLMPLVSMDHGMQIREEGRQPVLVFADGEHTLGLLVEEIVDIVDQPLNVELAAERPGFIGSAVIAGKATDVIDVGHYVAQNFDTWFGEGKGSADGDSASKRVLLVDDSPFFRNMLTPLLRVAGYDVTVAEAPDEALRLREDGADFDVIISDIEMPGMSGFEFATEVRREGAWQDVPMVALSSHTETQDFARGREAGFTDYVGKMDRDALLQALSQTLSMMGDAA